MSTELTLESLLKWRSKLVGVLGLERADTSKISGYRNFAQICKNNAIPYYGFSRINDQETIGRIEALAPDVIFVVGLSQLIDQKLLSIPSWGILGFHPTRLPEGRGRAPLAWITHDGAGGAATFFKIQAGVDDGPIVLQEEFEISAMDHAAEVEEKQNKAICDALDRILPELNAGRIRLQEQLNSDATYNGRRMPEDGLIDWNRSASEILNLIRAASRPHPGAFTYISQQKLTVWRAELSDEPYRGVTGRVLLVCDNGRVLVQTGCGLISLTEYEIEPDGRGESNRHPIAVGIRLGHDAELEIVKLREELIELRGRILALEATDNE